MEPITHLMTGACLARAGCNRKAAYATLAMTLAAEAPDLDTLWSIRGPLASFQHHRGITHTLVGLPVEAAILTALIYGLHRVRLHRASPASGNPQTATANLTAAPTRWPLLFAFTLLALLSHLLLDWTNNYGIRPFFPFNPHWYADSIVFIFEPVLFAVLLLGLLLPALFGLIAGEVGARRQPFRGRGFAIAALLATLALWSWRQFEHHAAVELATNSAFGPNRDVQPLRVTASPYPLNPYAWHIAVETPSFFQLASANTLHAALDTDAAQDLIPKPPVTPATLAASQSWLGRVYLDWSSWPIVTDTGLVTPIASAPYTAVTFRDLRFEYDTLFLQGRRNPPLSATAYVDASHHVTALELGGKPQK